MKVELLTVGLVMIIRQNGRSELYYSETSQERIDNLLNLKVRY